MSEAQSSKEQLYEIAAAIESRPVMGHWKHMRADKDAAAIRYAAAEIERLESCIRGLSSHAMKAAAEETRLRAALEGIREGYDGCDNCIGQACTWCLADKALRGGVETTQEQP